ncbi:MAG: hypothetical protein ABIX28_23375 [Vicinamibacterales bacterium]
MGKWFAAHSEQKSRLAVLGSLVLFGLLIAIVTLASSVVALAVGALTACVWCRWLEAHVGDVQDGAPSRIAAPRRVRD